MFCESFDSCTIVNHHARHPRNAHRTIKRYDWSAVKDRAGQSRVFGRYRTDNDALNMLLEHPCSFVKFCLNTAVGCRQDHRIALRLSYRIHTVRTRGEEWIQERGNYQSNRA